MVTAGGGLVQIRCSGAALYCSGGIPRMSSSGAVANGIGQPVRRKEDFRLLTGKGCFADDVRLPELAHAVIVRSPCPCTNRVGRQAGSARVFGSPRGAH